RSGENRREGFLVAQRGQALAADDSDRDASGQHWPVTRLVDQLRITVADLAEGFPGGPRIQLSLMEPTGNDQSLLMTLIGQPGADAGEDELEGEGPPPPPSRGGGLTQGFTAPTSGGAPSGAPAPGGARPAAGKPQQISAAEDAI